MGFKIEKTIGKLEVEIHLENFGYGTMSEIRQKYLKPTVGIEGGGNTDMVLRDMPVDFVGLQLDGMTEVVEKVVLTGVDETDREFDNTEILIEKEEDWKKVPVEAGEFAQEVVMEKLFRVEKESHSEPPGDPGLDDQNNIL